MLAATRKVIISAIGALQGSVQAIKILFNIGTGSVYSALQKFFANSLPRLFCSPISLVQNRILNLLNKRTGSDSGQEETSAATPENSGADTSADVELCHYARPRSYNIAVFYQFCSLLESFHNTSIRQEAFATAVELEVLRNQKLRELPLHQKNRLINLLNKHFEAVEQCAATIRQGNEKETLQVLANLRALMQALKLQLSKSELIDFKSLARALATPISLS